MSLFIITVIIIFLHNDLNFRHAVELGSSSGHPYNQLALLEASRDRLSTVFFYTRSIAVAHKFPAAITNLANTLMKSSKFE